MLRFVVDRFIQGIISLLVITFIVFLLGDLTGDPAEFYVNEDATFEQKERVRAKYGLDAPMPLRYVRWLGRMVTGNLGNSFQSHAFPVTKLISSRIAPSFQLAAVAISIILVLSIPLGVLAAIKRGSPFDSFVKALAISGQSIPQFWLAIMLIIVFGVYLRILPISGLGGPSHYVLPAIAAAWAGMAGLLRITRSSMLEVFYSDYIRTARAKGLAEGLVIWRHAFRNALIPIVTFTALLLAGMLNGFVIVEVVFAWPGLGLLTVEAVQGRDFPVLQALIVMIMTMYLVINFLVDVLYGFVDPRIKAN